VVLIGTDNELYTFAGLAAHPIYSYLVHDNCLLKVLLSPNVLRLLGQADGSQPLAGYSEGQLHQLAIAQRIASVVIHYAVRDSVKYELGRWRKTASEVLRTCEGTCSGSANLVTALGRAVGVHVAPCEHMSSCQGISGSLWGPIFSLARSG
jgi:hypothetical protein